MSARTYRFASSTSGAYAAAKRILPILLDYVPLPEKAVDLGGGGGGFLCALKERGTSSVVCLDHPSVTSADLMIPSEEFVPLDLRAGLPQPVPADLAISTECIEHLPASLNESVVSFLTGSAPVVLFAAAIPHQAGSGHINLQRPAYWRKLFAEREFTCLDIVRPHILYDYSLPFWYRQNLFLFVKESQQEQILLKEPPSPTLPDDFELVHTEILNRPSSFLEVVSEIIPSFSRAVKWRLFGKQS